jgi:hypothetical protein
MGVSQNLKTLTTAQRDWAAVAALVAGLRPLQSHAGDTRLREKRPEEPVLVGPGFKR